jgi:hypothetical protein
MAWAQRNGVAARCHMVTTEGALWVPQGAWLLAGLAAKETAPVALPLSQPGSQNPSEVPPGGSPRLSAEIDFLAEVRVADATGLEFFRRGTNQPQLRS